jgi:Phage-related minor tail protein
MAHAFSVFVNIGGKVSPSLGAAVSQAKAQVNSLGASLAGIGARLNAPFAAVNKHLAETSKRMATVQRAGRNATFGITTPTGLFAVSAIKAATERAKAANELEALGELSPEGRKDAERFADSISSKYGDATGILKTFNELLKAGFDSKSAKGSLPAILSGAAIAGDMPAADLGGYVSKIVTQFKLGMSTLDEATASSRRVIDNLVYGAVKTVASTKDMAEAYKYVGSAAAAAGESVESANAMIIALAKEGQLGSEAGVALRSAYVRMVKPTKASLATFARLGLNFGDYVQGGKRSGAGVVAGLGAAGFDMSGREKAIDKALAANEGNPEKQRKAIYDAVVAKIGANSATDRETLMRAVDDAFSVAGNRVDLIKLLTDLRTKGASQGDLANIFEGRQSNRLLALLKSDLGAILKDINEGAPGFAEKTWQKTYQGLPKAVLQLDSAWKTFRNTIVEAIAPKIVAGAERLANAVRSLAATSPGILKLGVGFAAAAAAAGPLLFVLGALGRVGMFAMRGLNFALLGLLLPFRLLGGVIAGVATAAVGRLAAMALGLRMLTALGAGAALSALGGSLLALGRSILLFPITALRAIGLAMWALVANPVGLIITALVAALAALGMWVYNNWNGIKEFFAGFGEGFMQGLGPAGPAVRALADGLGSVYNWLMRLVGPLDVTGAKWREWGATVGGVAAEGVKKVVSAIQSLIGFFGTAIDKAMRLGSAIKGIFTGGGAPAGGAAPAPIAGARALGGPVSYGKPYLVGEQGPELFVPGMSGRIEPNNTLRRLTADGTSAAAAAPSEHGSRAGGPIAITNHWTINGADDPRAVANQIDNRFAVLMRQLESEQRGLLSD